MRVKRLEVDDPAEQVAQEPQTNWRVAIGFVKCVAQCLARANPCFQKWNALNTRERETERETERHRPRAM